MSTSELRQYISESRPALRDLLLELLPGQGSYPSGIPGVSLHRLDSEEPSRPLVYTPMLVVVVQGRKWVKIGAEEFTYGDHTSFVAGIQMPVLCRVMEASPERPYLALTVDLDRDLLSWLTARDCSTSGYSGFSLPGARVHDIDDSFLDACLRLVKLRDKPAQIPFLAPLFLGEIHYRLLCGPFGRQLRTLYTDGSWGSRLAEAVRWLGRNYRDRLRVETLAGHAGMALPAFNSNFQTLTTVSPREYQQRLRLGEARRLVFHERRSAAEAACSVGYGNPDSFVREYRRLYGESLDRVGPFHKGRDVFT